ncbi:MAG: class I SAM-dependent methyltransferase [Cyclobacteriaceae bacterium]|nr:class I SAM-dependent methyltransferase [Cyclobacteriaceae bacterium]MCK5368846.1 class I SAM-dependent methyltransferase [Cyclobacteriaceae bacterium]MCK5703253.1 class I SAM-dependent methyltransferase [Cyclobacteriaceae bacterium]
MIFSKNPHKRAKSIFNLIAPIYSALDSYVKKGFSRAIHNVVEELYLEGKSVLDIGSGPGAWAALFKEHGASKVHGVDFAQKMILKANKRYAPAITFSIGNAENLSEFEDETFDIVTASFVLHGVKEDKRKLILDEMKRISKQHVIINDYYGPTPAVARFLEYLEKSDYHHFKANFLNELTNHFPLVKREDASFGTSVYFAFKNSEVKQE